MESLSVLGEDEDVQRVVGTHLVLVQEEGPLVEGAQVEELELAEQWVWAVVEGQAGGQGLAGVVELVEVAEQQEVVVLAVVLECEVGEQVVEVAAVVAAVVVSVAAVASFDDPLAPG